ncbi:MAG: YidC/Oxa1 family membrane protein insertase [Acidimicrobiales bacterium]
MFQFLANLLAFFYSLIPNYAIAIALLTLTVMLVLSPLTLKSTRSMLAMQKLQPEMKKLQQKHKGGDRQKLNEEMMALYKEHKVNPVAGCLPMLLQMPVFIVMYQVINGLTHTPRGSDDFAPKYLDKSTDLYRDLVEAGGQMKSFGIDLAKAASGSHGSFGRALPYFLIVALVIATQYFQTRQTMSRNTGQASQQQQIMLKVLPVFFGIISLNIPAGVNVYFLVSALFRIAQTGAMYRFDPTLREHARKHVTQIEAKATEVKGKPAAKPAAKPHKASSKVVKPSGAGGGRDAGPARPQGKANGRRPPARPPQKRRSKKGR